MSDPRNPNAGWNFSEGFTNAQARMRHYCEMILNSSQELLHEQLQTARDLVRSSEAGLLVPDEDEEYLRFQATASSQPHLEGVLNGVRVPIGDSLAGCVYTNGQAVALANPDDDDYYEEIDRITGLKTEVYLAVPVFDRGEMLGVLTFMNRPADMGEKTPRPFDAEEITHATRFASLVALGLRYHRRVHVLGRLFESELQDVVDPDTDCSFPQLSSEPDPMTRILHTLERLPVERHSLTADLLGVLAEHADEAES